MGEASPQSRLQAGADEPASVLIPGRRSLPNCYIVRPTVAINQIIRGRKVSQTGAARRLNMNQPKLSALSNYRLDGFSVERLMNFLIALDRDVEIIIRRVPRSRKGGRILVTAA